MILDEDAILGQGAILGQDAIPDQDSRLDKDAILDQDATHVRNALLVQGAKLLRKEISGPKAMREIDIDKEFAYRVCAADKTQHNNIETQRIHPKYRERIRISLESRIH